jgi:uncharacterized protein (TIGR03084 family)
MADLCDDLLLETEELDRVLAGLTEDQWNAPTPAPGWMVRDQISHLAHFDAVTTQSATDPEGFKADRDKVTDIDGLTSEVAERYRNLSGAELLAWFRRARKEFVAAFGDADPSQRVPWYGPDMSVASAVTARIMETWAHGQDVVDAVGGHREPTRALRQVAHIGVRALPNSFRARKLAVPTTEVRVELTALDGDVWYWGPEDAADRVTGPAVDFCLVVTQRRHPDDTALEITGPVATQWMSIAQAFAGPPGGGRKPGQFA